MMAELPRLDVPLDVEPVLVDDWLCAPAVAIRRAEKISARWNLTRPFYGVSGGKSNQGWETGRPGVN
jgi:hypothetical protein